MTPDWDDLVAGRVCPLCETVPDESEHGFRVADLRVSTLTLARDQAPRGYCIVRLRRHAVELFDLTPREAEGFILDVRAAARAVTEVFHCDKMNYLMLGNVVPHLHCHLWPRYADEPHWGRPLPFPVPSSPSHLPAPEYRDLVARLRAALPPWGGTE